METRNEQSVAGLLIRLDFVPTNVPFEKAKELGHSIMTAISKLRGDIGIHAKVSTIVKDTGSKEE